MVAGESIGAKAGHYRLAWGFLLGTVIISTAIYGLLRNQAPKSSALSHVTTINGIGLPTSREQIRAVLGKKREVEEKSGLYFPDLDLRITRIGGPDGGQLLRGRQLEFDGRIVLRAGMPKVEALRVLGDSSEPLIYTLKSDQSTVHHRLVVEVDSSEKLTYFELQYLYSVD